VGGKLTIERGYEHDGNQWRGVSLPFEKQRRSSWLPKARNESVARIRDVRFAKCGHVTGLPYPEGEARLHRL